ncbi:MAG: chorismate mutase [Candidatus Margulisiibacteriota bacterium]
MALRGIRGATAVGNNSKEEIISATKELLGEIVAANQLEIEEIASVIFSVTKDLNAEFPAVAARELGWNDTPLLCTYEIDVPGSLPRCIRVLLHVNTEKKQKEMKHIYLAEAQNLRR